VFVAEKPRLWRANFSGTDFDLAPDGKRLAVVVQTEAPQPEHEAVFIETFSKSCGVACQPAGDDRPQVHGTAIFRAN
jgi:hypothetical protein